MSKTQNTSDDCLKYNIGWFQTIAQQTWADINRWHNVFIAVKINISTEISSSCKYKSGLIYLSKKEYSTGRFL